MKATRTAAEPFRETDFAVEDRGHTIDGKPSPCRIWQRGKTKGGYSCLRVEGTTFYGHRVAAVLASGAIPQGYDVHHKCGQRDCCHPDHLEMLLPADNVRDGKLAKLTREQVAEIKRRVEAGERQAALAREFGVAPGTVSKLLRAKPKRRRAHVILTDEQKLDIWTSRRRGETLRSIGERNGVDPNYVIAVMQRAPSRQGLRAAAREVLRALVDPWDSLDVWPVPVDRIDVTNALGEEGPLSPRERVLVFRALAEGYSLREAGAEQGLKASSAARLLYDAAGSVAEWLWPRHWAAADPGEQDGCNERTPSARPVPRATSEWRDPRPGVERPPAVVVPVTVRREGPMRVSGSAAALGVEGRERLLGTATDPLLGLSPGELEAATVELLAADSGQELCRTCKEAGVYHARGVPNGSGRLECEAGHTWAPGEGAVREKAPYPHLSERQLKERRTREVFCEAGTPVGVTPGMFWRTHPRGRRVSRAPTASFYR